MTRKPNLETDRFVLVEGGTFPMQNTRPDKMRKPLKGQYDDDEPFPHCWIEIDADPAECPQGPVSDLRPGRFRVVPQIVVGTVDEIVAAYRSRLETAVKTMLGDIENDDDPRAWVWPALVENQAVLDKLIEEGKVFPDTHGAYTARWRESNVPLSQPHKKEESSDVANTEMH